MLVKVAALLLLLVSELNTPLFAQPSESSSQLTYAGGVIEFLKKDGTCFVSVTGKIQNDIELNCCQFRSTTKESFSIVNHCSNMG
jgi:hypothetical protein